MNGQMTFSEKEEQMNNFICRCDPYSTVLMPKFDLRGYARYLEEHHLDGFSVTNEIMNMFQVEPITQ